MLQNQHDKFFKGIFSQSEHAADLLRNSLPPALLVHLDLRSLELAPGSFVDDDETLRRVLGPAIHAAFMNTAEMIHKRGLEQGREQGREQGQSMLLLLLEDRFGALPEGVEKRVRAAGFEQLKAWTRAVLRASTLDDVFAA